MLCKVLVDGRSCHGGNMEWSLPSVKGPGKWHQFDGQIEICRSGLHLTTAPYQSWMLWGARVYEVEAQGIIEWQEDKCVCRRARLIREVAEPWWTEAGEFVAKLPSVPYFQPDDKPLRSWKLFTAAAGDAGDVARAAAWDAAGAAARDAARDAAWGNVYRDAAWDAARATAGDAARDAAGVAAGDAAGAAAGAAAWDAAWAAAWAAARAAAGAAAGDAAGDAGVAAGVAAGDAGATARAAAWDAAGAAARDAARDAAQAAARAAAWDAALYARSIIAGDKLAKKHRDHIKARWRVWQKGYALLCDVNGTLYVYSIDKPKAK